MVSHAGGFTEGCAAVVAGAFVFGCFDDVWCFGFLSGGAFVSFGSAWEAFGVFCVVSVSGGVHSSGGWGVGVFVAH